MKTYSLHKFKNKPTLPFSATEYSLFKFGSKNIARKYGIELAKGFIEEVLKKETPKGQIVVCSSPYFFIPTATFAMKDYFIRELNYYLIDNGMEAVEELKIHRTITYTQDYGEMSKEERTRLIGNDTFYMDAQFLKDKYVLFLDDVKITGSHEKAIKKSIEINKVAPKDIYFLYFAELKNPKEDPKIENYLNHAYVKSLNDINDVFKKEFLLNTRVIKYILNSPKQDFKEFIALQPQNLINNIYHLAIGNRYYKIKEYSDNLKQLSDMLK